VSMESLGLMGEGCKQLFRIINNHANNTPSLGGRLHSWTPYARMRSGARQRQSQGTGGWTRSRAAMEPARLFGALRGGSTQVASRR
jgi:hypothetical protein